VSEAFSDSSLPPPQPQPPTDQIDVKRKLLSSHDEMLKDILRAKELVWLLVTVFLLVIIIIMIAH
jgi:hypothetical protein